MESILVSTGMTKLGSQRYRLPAMMALAAIAFASTTWMPKAGAAQPQALSDQIAGLEAELAPRLEKRTALTETKKSLELERDEIEFGVAALKKSVAQYSQQVNEYNLELAAAKQSTSSFNAELTAHNAVGCTYTERNPSACASYDAEARRLNQRKSSLEQKFASLAKTEDFLLSIKAKDDELRGIISGKTTKWSARVKQFNAAYDDNEAAIRGLQSQIASLKDTFQQCVNTLQKGASLELIHEICGQPFDGNVVHTMPQSDSPAIRRLREADAQLRK